MSKVRERRHAMAVAHARRQDNRREATTGIKASDRRRVLREQRREARRAARKATR